MSIHKIRFSIEGLIFIGVITLIVIFLTIGWINVVRPFRFMINSKDGSTYITKNPPINGKPNSEYYTVKYIPHNKKILRPEELEDNYEFMEHTIMVGTSKIDLESYLNKKVVISGSTGNTNKQCILNKCKFFDRNAYSDVINISSLTLKE